MKENFSKHCAAFNAGALMVLAGLWIVCAILALSSALLALAAGQMVAAVVWSAVVVIDIFMCVQAWRTMR
jgi:hypothetical protein